MKILHIVNESLPEVNGYTIRGSNIYKVQKENGLEPVVVTSTRHEPDVTGPIETIAGIKHYRTVERGGFDVPILRELRSVRQMASKVVEIATEEKPRILHSHSPCLWGAAAARAARRLQLPFVHEIRGFWEDAAVDVGKMKENSLKYRAIRDWETHICKRASAVVTIAEHMKRDLIARGIDERKIFLARNGVEVERFGKLPPDSRLTAELGLTNHVCIGYVGTMSPWEGVDDLLRAIPILINSGVKAKVVVVGGGSLAPVLEKLVNQLDLSDHVRLVGSVNHDQVESYYSIMDIVVYPRRSTRNTELCTPLKPLEAMAMEKVVVGSDVGGIEELLASKGRLFKSGDPRDLARVCAELVQQPELRERLGHAAREHVVNERSWRQTTQAYNAVYDYAYRDLQDPKKDE